jgi:hypothetical protein
MSLSSDPNLSAAREKATLPATFLLVVGIINLLASGLLLLGGPRLKEVDPVEFERTVPEWYKDMLEQTKKQAGMTTAEILEWAATLASGWGGIALVCGLLTVAGGVAFLKLGSLPLAIIGAIAASVPILSPLGCCLIGEAVGVWSLVVMLSPDVRSAFGSAAPPPPEDTGWGHRET